MTIDELQRALYPQMTDRQLRQNRKQMMLDIQQVLGITWAAVWKWDTLNKGIIPPARAIELVRYYNLDPQILVR